MRSFRLLYQFINCLSKGEKKQLNVSTQKQKKSSIATQLYAYLNRKKDFDHNVERKMESILADTVRPDQVMLKLIEDISLSLSSQNDYSKKAEVYKLLMEVEFLFNKGQYELMLKFLRKAKRMVKEYEFLELHLEILERELYYVGLKKNPNFHNVYQELRAEEKETVHKLMNLNELIQVHKELYQTIRKSTKNIDVAAINEAAQHEILSSFEKANSLRAKGVYMNCHLMIARLTKNESKALEVCKAYLDILNENPKYIQANKPRYLSVNQHYLISCMKLNQLDGVLSAIKKLWNLETVNEHEKIYKYELIIPIILYFYALPNQSLEELAEYLPEFESIFEQYQPQMSQLFTTVISSSLSRVYFLMEDFDKAKQWNEWQLTNQPKELRVDLCVFARFLELFIFAEQGLHSLVKSKIPGLKIALETKNIFDKKEKIVLNFIGKYSAALEQQKEQSTIIKLLKELKTQLCVLSEEERQASYLVFLDFEAWAVDKINRFEKQSSKVIQPDFEPVF